MVFLITSLIAALVSLYIFSIKQAFIYGLVVLLFITLGKVVLMGIAATILPHTFRIKHMQEVEMWLYVFACLVFIIISYWFNKFLIIPSTAACLIDYYWKRESDKVLFRK